MEKKQFVVKDNETGMRIDQYLASQIPTLSRRKIRGILDIGGCYVNNKRMHIASRQVNGGDKVRVEYTLTSLSAVRQKTFKLLDSDILYDDHHVIAMNKPPGLPSQATRDQDVVHAEISLKEWLKSKNRGGEKLILLHRLDKETSGILLFATNTNTATWITDQFKQRTLNKTYLAITYGCFKQQKTTKECYLSEIDKKTGQVSIVRSGGRHSKTEFEVLKSNQKLNLSLVACYPETGRSHQIRVHLESLQHPIIGDKRYGKEFRFDLPTEISNESGKHHMLHAKAISFVPAPGLESVMIEANPPESFQKVISLI